MELTVVMAPAKITATIAIMAKQAAIEGYSANLLKGLSPPSSTKTSCSAALQISNKILKILQELLKISG